VGGSSKLEDVSSMTGLPLELLQESESASDGLVYPDNMQVVSIFNDMMTQWRVGATGATGLDYAALPAVLSIRRVKIADREDIFECLRIMESAALTEMRSE